MKKTPSFSVSPDKQFYHCFGCGKGGGVINFIMDIENLSYPEAVEFLAKRANMPMPEETNDAESRKRARMLALNKDAARFFYDQLSTPFGREREGIHRQAADTPGNGQALRAGSRARRLEPALKRDGEKGATPGRSF